MGNLGNREKIKSKNKDKKKERNYRRSYNGIFEYSQLDYEISLAKRKHYILTCINRRTKSKKQKIKRKGDAFSSRSLSLPLSVFFSFSTLSRSVTLQ